MSPKGPRREAFRDALSAGRPEPHLHRIQVGAGDHFCVPSGTIHAIMGGLLIAEIQQNSNTTYRVYDWNRVGPDGKPRALHLDRALDVIDFGVVEPTVRPPETLEQANGYRRSLLCRNRYFVTERIEMDEGALYRGDCDGTTLEIWGAIAGAATVAGETLAAVRFVLLPAALGRFTVTAPGGATLLRTYVQ